MNCVVFLCINQNLRKTEQNFGKTGQIRSKSGHRTFDEKTGLSWQIYSRWSPYPYFCCASACVGEIELSKKLKLIDGTFFFSFLLL